MKEFTHVTSGTLCSQALLWMFTDHLKSYLHYRSLNLSDCMRHVKLPLCRLLSAGLYSFIAFFLVQDDQCLLCV